MAKRESRRRQRIIKALEAEGWLVDSNPAGPSQRKGRSDLTVCAAGRYAAVEVKVDDDDLPEPSQVRYLLEVQQRGGLGFVTRDPLHAVATIKQWLGGYPVVDFDFGFLDDALPDKPAETTSPDLDSWSFDPSALVEQDEDGNVRLANAPAPDRVIYPDGTVHPISPPPYERIGDSATFAKHNPDGRSEYIIPEDDFRQPSLVQGLTNVMSDINRELFAPGATGPVPHVSSLRAVDVTPEMQEEMVQNALNGHSLADEGMPVPHAFEGFGVLERIEWKLDELCRVLGHSEITRGQRPTLPPALVKAQASAPHTSVGSTQEVTTTRRRGRPRKDS